MALTHEANEIRNREIGAALEVFFRLAQAESREEILRKSKDEMGRALESMRAQLQRGLLVQESYDTLRREDIELRGKQRELYWTIERLNRVLTYAVSGSASTDAVLIKPTLDWSIALVNPDPDRAIAVGLASRPQLLLLRTIVAASDSDTLPMMDKILGSANPLLAIELPGRYQPLLSRLAAGLHHQEPAAVCRGRDRARQILAWREQEVIEEIRNAALGVAAAADKVAIARERSQALAAELDRTVAKAKRGLTPSAEVSSARLALLRAQSPVVDDVIEWHIQGLKLAQAQGILYRSCGDSSAGLCPGVVDAPR